MKTKIKIFQKMRKGRRALQFVQARSRLLITTLKTH